MFLQPMCQFLFHPISNTNRFYKFFTYLNYFYDPQRHEVYFIIFILHFLSILPFFFSFCNLDCYSVNYLLKFYILFYLYMLFFSIRSLCIIITFLFFICLVNIFMKYHCILSFLMVFFSNNYFVIIIFLCFIFLLATHTINPYNKCVIIL